MYKYMNEENKYVDFLCLHRFMKLVTLRSQIIDNALLNPNPL